MKSDETNLKASVNGQVGKNRPRPICHEYVADVLKKDRVSVASADDRA